jgi:NAD(P)-dependent dehydrogenase (short-subunit alcohol dehydrogenase family)
MRGVARTLDGKVAIVAGGTRGAGRAISIELGALGATVYVTGRTTRESKSPMGRSETIEETADRADAAGGHGIAVRVDHMVPEEVAALVERVREEQGRLDVLVNDVWGGDPFVDWDGKLWEQPLDKTLGVIRNGIETHVVTSRLALPLMIEGGGGIVIEVTDGVSDAYRGNFAYDFVKAGVIRLAVAQAAELREHGIAAVAVSPGFLRSEAMLDHFGVTEDNWRDAAAKDPHFIASETPHFVARGIAALCADPDAMRFSGQAIHSGMLGEEYEVDDLDGSRPNFWAYAEENVKGWAG